MSTTNKEQRNKQEPEVAHSSWATSIISIPHCGFLLAKPVRTTLSCKYYVCLSYSVVLSLSATYNITYCYLTCQGVYRSQTKMATLSGFPFSVAIFVWLTSLMRSIVL